MVCFLQVDKVSQTKSILLFLNCISSRGQRPESIATYRLLNKYKWCLSWNCSASVIHGKRSLCKQNNAAENSFLV